MKEGRKKIARGSHVEAELKCNGGFERYSPSYNTDELLFIKSS